MPIFLFTFRCLWWCNLPSFCLTHYKGWEFTYERLSWVVDGINCNISKEKKNTSKSLSGCSVQMVSEPSLTWLSNVIELSIKTIIIFFLSCIKPEEVNPLEGSITRTNVTASFISYCKRDAFLNITMWSLYLITGRKKIKLE